MNRVPDDLLVLIPGGTRVSGTIIEIHTSDFDYKGHTHRASADDPQYEIASDKTDHVAAHKGSALTKI